MSKPTKHDELVFEALADDRNVGADMRAVRKYVQWYGKRKSSVKNDQASLKRLEKAGDVLQVAERFFLTVQGAKRAKGSATPATWLREDHWLLLAVVICAGDEGANLSQIIGAADYIDHGLPTLEQLHGALNRLASGGLIAKRRGLFALTERGLELADKAKACSRRGIRGQSKALGRLLDCPSCGVDLRKVRWSILLDQAMVDEACRDYRRR
ncbi:MAG: hypothetical protein JRH20_14785 [Deltaproteobacteria bacterium]|nr:hypothetical protein [Deltaproteobacteria bacterium]